MCYITQQLIQLTKSHSLNSTNENLSINTVQHNKRSPAIPRMARPYWLPVVERKRFSKVMQFRTRYGDVAI